MSLNGELFYNVCIHDEGEDGLWAEVEELPGLFASGENEEELNEALAEAIGIYLSAPGSKITVTRAERQNRSHAVREKFLIDA